MNDMRETLEYFAHIHAPSHPNMTTHEAEESYLAQLEDIRRRARKTLLSVPPAPASDAREMINQILDALYPEQGISREEGYRQAMAVVARHDAALLASRQGGWISIKERLPEPKQSVLVILDTNNSHYSGQMHVCRFSPFDYGDGKPIPEFSMPGFGGLSASHWMPLPPHPELGACAPSEMALAREMSKTVPTGEPAGSLAFPIIVEELLSDREAKSEYVQAAIILLRGIFQRLSPSETAPEGGEGLEPGEPIMKGMCPCCGNPLQVMVGDDEGKATVLGLDGRGGIVPRCDRKLDWTGNSDESPIEPNHLERLRRVPMSETRLLFSPQEAAEALGVSIITIRRAFYAGRLSGVKIGKLVRFRREAIETFIDVSAIPAGGQKWTRTAKPRARGGAHHSTP